MQYHATASIVLLAACTGGHSGGGDNPALDAGVDADMADASPACTVLPSAGCPNGLSCDLAVVDAPFCRPFTSGTDTRTACTKALQCDRGWTCADEAGATHCMKWCTSDPDCGAGHCLADGFSGLGLCSDACDLAAPAATCPAGASCFPSPLFAGGPKMTVSCGSTGTGAISAPCLNDNDCAPGLGCSWSSVGAHTCRPWCKVDAARSSCATGTGSCVAVTTLDGVKYGFCQ
jgi:hypothetical protein